jgi:hypothetical protein
MWQPPLVGQSRNKPDRGARLVGSPIPIGALGAVIGILPTIPAVCLAVASAGGGHGNYLFALLFYPIPMFLLMLLGENIAPVVIVLGVAQFSIYGGILGYCATVSQRCALIAGGVLAAIHVLPLLLLLLATLI